MPYKAQLPRRRFVQAGGLLLPAALQVGSPVNAQLRTADHTIRIAPVELEIAPGRIVKTTAYNGTVPGPTLRLQEGKPVAINVINDSGYPNLVHWHGLFLLSEQDGAVEEGSPIILPGQSLTYSFTPRPQGTRFAAYDGPFPVDELRG